MTITVVNHFIDNEGPTPPTTQDVNGITTAMTTTADPLLAWTTCATYGGPHSGRTLTSKLGTYFGVPTQSVIGGQGNLDSDQEFNAWYAPNVVAGADELAQLYEGGDRDYQAAIFGNVKGVGKLLLARGSAQGPIGPGPGLLNAGSFEITADMVPCVAVIACQCISELGKHYTPSTAHGVGHWGDWWRFQGEGDGSNNLCLGFQEITAPGTYTPACNAQSTTAEYYQTIVEIFADVSGVTIPPAHTQAVPVTQDQIAHLAAGGALALQPTP